MFKNLNKDAEEIIKGCIKIPAYFGGTIILHNLISAITPKNIHPAKKLCIVVAEFLIADILCDKLMDQSDKTVDLIKESLIPKEGTNNEAE